MLNLIGSLAVKSWFGHDALELGKTHVVDRLNVTEQHADLTGYLLGILITQLNVFSLLGVACDSLTFYLLVHNLIYTLHM